MTRIYLVISLTMLAANLLMEYSTLTRRGGLARHLISRGLAAGLMTVLMIALIRRGLKGSYLLRVLATFPFFLSCQDLFSESPAQKTFLYFMDFSATSFLSSVCVWISAVLPIGWSEDAIASALFVLVLVLLIPLYIRYLRPRVRRMLYLFRSANPLYAAYPVLSFALFAILFAPVDVPTSLKWFAAMLLYMATTVLTYVMLFSHFTSLYDRLEAESSAARAERQVELQKKYYEEVDRGLRAQGKLLHDARHHLVAVAAMARTGEGEGIDGYVEGLLDQYASAEAPAYCENAVVNAVIGGYVAMAEGRGIRASTDLDLRAGIEIDEYELCSFFGNALENAVEACERIPAGSALRSRRFIDVEARIDSGKLVIRVENSCHDDPARKEPGFPSSKGSGIGLRSMRAVAERHGGGLSCERRGEVFVLSAVLCFRP